MSSAPDAGDVEAKTSSSPHNNDEDKSQSQQPSNAQAPAPESSQNMQREKSLEESKDTEEDKRADGAAPPLPSEEPPLPNEEPPLPNESEPPLLSEAPPSTESKDDGWAPVWDATAGAFYFHNRFTQATQWENPRVPEASASPSLAPGVAPASGVVATGPLSAAYPAPTTGLAAGGYDPAIHGSYDENAWYAQPTTTVDTTQPTTSLNLAEEYAQTGQFNRFTGRWQAADLQPEKFNDENKSKRQMNAFFDVDLAANSHDGKSLKAERQQKKLSKKEVKDFKNKRRVRKEEKRRAWLLD